MSRSEIAKSLAELSQSDNKRSKAARLRDVIEDVERSLQAGVKRASILEALEKNGLQMSMSTFATILKRHRAKARLQPKAKAPLSTPTPSPPEADAETPSASHDPQSLNQIINNTPNLAALAKQSRRKK